MTTTTTRIRLLRGTMLREREFGIVCAFVPSNSVFRESRRLFSPTRRRAETRSWEVLRKFHDNHNVYIGNGHDIIVTKTICTNNNDRNNNYCYYNGGVIADANCCARYIVRHADGVRDARQRRIRRGSVVFSSDRITLACKFLKIFNDVWWERENIRNKYVGNSIRDGFGVWRGEKKLKQC